MSFMESLFGHGSSDPSWIKNQGRSILDDYNQYLQAAYSPQAIQGQIGNFTGDYYRNLNNVRGAETVGMGQRGFRQTPTHAYRASQDISNFAANARQQGRMGLLNGQQGRLGILQGIQPMFHRNASQGLWGTLQQGLGQAAQAYGASQGIPMGGGNANPYGTGGNMTPNVYADPNAWNIQQNPEYAAYLNSLMAGG